MKEGECPKIVKERTYTVLSSPLKKLENDKVETVGSYAFYVCRSCNECTNLKMQFKDFKINEDKSFDKIIFEKI